MIRFDHVFKRYPDGQEALRDISFEIERGEMAFLTGHSGAGKSTVLRLTALLERPTRGAIMVGGVPFAQIRDSRVPFIRRQVGYIFQDHRLLLDRTVFENVSLPLVISGYDRADIPRRVRAALDKVGLLGKEHLLPAALSSGEQQRVGIARAVVHKPPLVLADEPTGNLDPALSQEIMEVFVDLNRVGVTVLVATHDLPLVTAFGHRQVILEAGRLQAPEEHAATGS